MDSSAAAGVCGVLLRVACCGGCHHDRWAARRLAVGETVILQCHDPPPPPPPPLLLLLRSVAVFPSK